MIKNGTLSPALNSLLSRVRLARLEELDAIRSLNMPNAPAISNLWNYATRRGFD
jgi:beta-galactosidase